MLITVLGILIRFKHTASKVGHINKNMQNVVRLGLAKAVKIFNTIVVKESGILQT
jgi:hypothetical protein